MARRKVTSQDVAKRAGVSRTTVSFVLNKVPGTRISAETQRKVIEAAEDLGYSPHAAARSLVTQRSHTVGLVLCQSPDTVFQDAFLPEVLRGVGQPMRERGYRILVESLEDISQPGAYIDLVLGQRTDGLILSGPRSDDKELERLRDEGFPMVLLGQLPNAGIPSVDVDNVAGARHAVEHLLSLGHRRIGFISNAPIWYTSSAHRLQGYREALAAYQVSADDSLVRYGHYTDESGYEAMCALLETTPLPTAVFIASDLVAFGAMAAVRDNGLSIPEDIAVVGFDDVRMARYVNPHLTTVHLPAFELGHAAAQLLLDWMDEGEMPPSQVLLPTQLVIRQSCGAQLTAETRTMPTERR
jgi:LacI family transcriptional regulator